MPMARTWEGLSLQSRVHRASGRAITAIATHVAVETKKVTHVQYGTLRRSVHAAPPGYDGADDEKYATSSDLQANLPGQADKMAQEQGDGPMIEVGSWLPYACAEWIGRGHPGINEGLEAVRGARIASLVRLAFQEEGL